MLRKLSGYIFLYGAHALKVFSFIILIPHFTKIFPKNIWGNIMMVQAFSLWLQILIEYGFNLSATREMARVRDNNGELSQLVGGVAGAKIILSALAVLVGVVGYITNPAFGRDINLLKFAVIFSIVQGFNPIWYFLAREKFSQFASIDFLARFLYLVGCLVFINNDSHGELVFIIGIITGMMSNLLGYGIIYKQVPFSAPNMKSTINALKSGFNMFIFVGITSIYTTLNIVILGLSQPASTVAVYGIADKIVRAAGGLLDPINRVVYSKLSYLYHHDFNEAVNFLRKAGMAIFLFSLLIFIGGFTFSNETVAIIAPLYPETVEYLKVLLIFIPILALNNIVGLHIMLPLGMDRKFNSVFIFVSLLSSILMYVMIPRTGAFGLAYITILTEFLAFVGMTYFVVLGRVFSRKYLLEVPSDKSV